MSFQLLPSTARLSAFELPDAIERFGAGCTVLSLDCFDTLLWRQLYAPIDLFAHLPECSFRQRVQAEELARARRAALKGGPEVTLRDIYRQMRPNATAAALERWCEQEIEHEKQVLEAFSPTVELMHRAKARGMQIMIVSDTYFTEEQLRGLLEHCLGRDTAAMIDRIFVSSAFGISKAQGLFGSVLEALGVSPGSILHIGDNFKADFEGAQRFGLHAVHLVQFSPEIEQRLRLESVGAGFFDARLRKEQPTWQVHRRLVGAKNFSPGEPATMLGYCSIGPIIDAFARWTLSHVAALSSSQRQVRVAYLMRDGHLPHLAHEALTQAGEERSASRIELSRFAAYASSFDSSERIADYLAEFAPTRRFDAVGQQLLLTPAEIKSIIESLPKAGSVVSFFCRKVLSTPWLERIITRSQAYAERMAAHVRQQTGCQPGDLLLLVDLGYAGTVQDRVRQTLARLLGVEVRGAYLLLRDMTDWQHDKAAMFSAKDYDFRSIDALAAYVALLEQMCTVEQASVIDYQPDGVAVRKSADRKARQSEVRSLVQAAALDYVHDRSKALTPESASNPAQVQASITTALGALARLLFLPDPSELALLEGFDHDVNLGVADTVHLFDPHAARQGLVRRGLFYTNDNPRLFLPAEVRAEGLATSFLVMNQRRHGFDLRASDFAQFSKTVPVMIASEKETIRSSALAVPTHDGYFCITVNIGKSSLAVGFQLGAIAALIEVHSISSSKAASFMTQGDAREQRDLRHHVMLEQVDALSPELMRFHSAQGFLFVPPGAPADADTYITLVFRPIGAPAPSVSATKPSQPTEAMA